MWGALLALPIPTLWDGTERGDDQRSSPALCSAQPGPAVMRQSSAIAAWLQLASQIRPNVLEEVRASAPPYSRDFPDYNRPNTTSTVKLSSFLPSSGATFSR